MMLQSERQLKSLTCFEVRMEGPSTIDQLLTTVNIFHVECVAAGTCCISFVRDICAFHLYWT